MSEQLSFESAQERVKKLKSKPSNNELLSLYALFKQATEGDCNGKRPGMMDVKGRAKYDAWNSKSGLSGDEARNAYVELVSKLEGQYGISE